MNNPFTFIIPVLIAIVCVMLFGALFGGGEERPTKPEPAYPTDAELLAREVSELKKRLVIERGGAL